MIKILFVCHGNICRSTMAEFVLKDMVKKANLEKAFFIASAGTSAEELGNPVHPGTKRILKFHGISCEGKEAVQLKKADYHNFDYLIGMEERNIYNMNRILGSDPEKKISRLLDFTNHVRDIADPWYTGDFEQTYSDVYEGCKELLESVLAKRKDMV